MHILFVNVGGSVLTLPMMILAMNLNRSCTDI